MAEGMIEEFHRYLVERVTEEADSEIFAYEDGDNKSQLLHAGRKIMAEMILKEFEKRFSL